jgi:hypothetical protein
MAHDKTPERGNLIIFYTALSIVTLFVLAFVFKSYFNIETTRELTTKVLAAPTTELTQLESRQREELTTGPMPIDRAMKRLARTSDRALLGTVEPEPSSDTAALEGWSFARSAPPVADELPPVGEATDAGTGEATGAAGTDGGAMGAGEGAGSANEPGAAGTAGEAPEGAEAAAESASAGGSAPGQATAGLIGGPGEPTSARQDEGSAVD